MLGNKRATSEFSSGKYAQEKIAFVGFDSLLRFGQFALFPLVECAVALVERKMLEALTVETCGICLNVQHDFESIRSIGLEFALAHFEAFSKKPAFLDLTRGAIKDLLAYKDLVVWIQDEEQEAISLWEDARTKNSDPIESIDLHNAWRTARNYILCPDIKMTSRTSMVANICVMAFLFGKIC